jgi:Zinc finger, ZZ type
LKFDADDSIACNKMIYGIRYKCLMCSDFDLCMHCEALPISVHPDTHVLCKIKSGIVTASHPLFRAMNSLDTEISHEESPQVSLDRDSVPTISITKTVSLEQTAEKVLPDIPKSPYMSERTASPLQYAAKTDVPLLKAIFLSDNNMPDGALLTSA